MSSSRSIQSSPDHRDGDNHGGFTQDMLLIERQLIGRRRAMGMLGLGASALLSSCGDGSSGTITPTPSPTPTPTPTATPTPTPTPTATQTGSGSCVSYATETSGPFPADGTNSAPGSTSNVLTLSGAVRSDIRSSFVSSTTVAPGVPLTLTIQLADVNNSCAPLAGYAVYIWHCSRDGQYSLYDVPAESYLRGLQVADSAGRVTFTTVYPGAYSGRYPHIHIEVFSSLANATRGNFARLTSQFALPDASNLAVYASAGYASSQTNYPRTPFNSDGIFADNTAAQKTAMTLVTTGSVSAGYAATVTVGMTT